MRSFLFIILVVTLNSCKEKVNDCFETIEFNKIEQIEYGCKYKVQLSLDTTIVFEFIEINDFRTYGALCMQSTGGYATIFFRLEHIQRRKTNYLDLNVFGCVNTDFNLDYPNLPSINYGTFNLVATKLLPVSSGIESKPSSISDYSIKIGVLR